MNNNILKDVKVMSGLISSILLAGIAIVLAMYNISYWVLFTVLSTFILFLSLNRADKITKN